MIQFQELSWEGPGNVAWSEGDVPPELSPKVHACKRHCTCDNHFLTPISVSAFWWGISSRVVFCFMEILVFMPWHHSLRSLVNLRPALAFPIYLHHFLSNNIGAGTKLHTTNRTYKRAIFIFYKLYIKKYSFVWWFRIDFDLWYERILAIFLLRVELGWKQKKT